MKTDGTLLRIGFAASFTVAMFAQPLRASIAYGSINNFDTVNDTGHECHGFEIEIEDCRSTDISYTYDYNHYGTSKITQDDSVPGHPKCLIRWASKKNPDGTWASFTAIPSGPVNPTDGHQFTNPAVNFGGEHFGVGYNVAVGAVRYNWLIDDGSGNLVSGGQVQVSTPVYTYYPPIDGGAPQIQAVIAPPPPEVPEPKEFGKAVWVKEIRTTSHNNNEVKLRDLVSDDPDDADDKNWKNGEPDEVEVEWQILQKDTGKADGGPNNEVPAAAEDLPGGDEVVTRRYEFYQYIGPIDNESGEAMGTKVGPDDSHGVGVKMINGVEVDLSAVEVVGEFTGSQMAAVDVDAPVGLIDHVSEAGVDEPFAARSVVVPGAFPFICMRDGILPAGMVFDEITGVLSGTPQQSGEFNFRITASDAVNPEISKNYTLLVAAAGAALPPSSIVDTASSPVEAGTTSGDGAFDPGSQVTVNAAPLAGFRFVNWTDDGKVVSNTAGYTFTIDVNHSLVANFTADPAYAVTTGSNPAEGGVTTGAGPYSSGSSATVTAIANEGYVFTRWTVGGNSVSTLPGYTFIVNADRSLVANFVIAGTQQTITTSASPQAWGDTSGGGSYTSGDSATVIATPNSGYAFSGWQEGDSTASTSASYTFTVAGSRTLTAKFIEAFVITANVSPPVGGTTEMDSTSYKSGENAKASATPANGFSFSNWTEDGVILSTDPDYRFDVTGNRTLVANFSSNSGFTINTNPAPAAGGTTTGDGAYHTGETVMVSAVPNEGYGFVNWTQGATVVSTESDYSFTADASRQLVAHFAASVAITASASPPEGGIVSGAGSYPVGAAVSLTAAANPGFAFNGWAEGSTAIDAGATYGFNVTAARALVANFIAVPQVAVVTGAPGAQTMEITWPAAALGWVLEESLNLVDWTPSALPVTTTGDTNNVSVTTSGAGRYFRLSHP